MAKPLKADKRFFYRLDAHYRMAISLVVAAISFFCLRAHVHLPSLILFTWISFALTVILMDWIIISTSHPREVRAIAKLQDSSRTAIFLFILCAAIASLGAIVSLLKSAKG